MAQSTRPDFSKFVVHFTKDAAPFANDAVNENATLAAAINNRSAAQRFQNMLTSCVIHSTKQNWTDLEAVCFTECSWLSLKAHALHYSAFGLGFTKQFLFQHDGGPAIYLRADLFKKQTQEGLRFDSDVFRFVTPFWPFYASQTHKDRYYDGKAGIDYSHEREWRVPHDLRFSATDLAFVIVPTQSDLSCVPTSVAASLGTNKMLVLDSCEDVNQSALIQEFWPGS